MPTMPSERTAPPSAETPTASAFRGLVRVLGLLRRVMEPYFARHGISGAQWGILRALQRAEDDGASELRLVDLSARLLVRPPSITSAIGRLAKMGLVTLTQSRKDQRVKLVSLSPAGRKLVAHVLAGHADQMARVLGGLSEPEQATLSDLLSRMSNHLEHLADAEPEPPATSDDHDD